LRREKLQAAPKWNKKLLDEGLEGSLPNRSDELIKLYLINP